MNKDHHISEEQLNAFVDGELESEESNCLFDEAERSAELDLRISQQRKLKELIKHAYREVPEPKRLSTSPRTRRSLFGLAIAAAMLVVLGTTVGLLAHEILSRGPNTAANNPQVAATVENYILHVVSGEPEQMKRVLQKAKELLASAEFGKPRKVEVVANEAGLNLLRNDVTPFPEEIRALANEDVIFYACSKAIKRLEEKGVEVRLVPEANSHYTALDRVVIRMKDGWQYIKI